MPMLHFPISDTIKIIILFYSNFKQELVLLSELI